MALPFKAGDVRFRLWCRYLRLRATSSLSSCSDQQMSASDPKRTFRNDYASRALTGR